MPKNRFNNEPRVELTDASSTQTYLQRFTFDKFDEESEEWRFYIQRFEIALARHGVPDDDNVMGILLLSSVGPTVFRLLAEHVHPQQVNSVGYKKLKQILNDYYTTNDLIFANRRAFAVRFRQDGESIKHYVKDLRSLASICQFGRCLEEHLRDQIVIGINNDNWQQELIRQFPSNDTTLVEVERTAVLLEQTSEHQFKLKELSNSHGNYVHKSKNARLSNAQNGDRTVELMRGKDCFRCGFRLHKHGEVCPAADKFCKACKKKGHFARACISKGGATIVNQILHEKNSASHFEGSVVGSDVSVNAVNKVGSKAMLDVEINGVMITMLYDPGASETIISRQIWTRIGSPALEKSNRNLVAYTDVHIKTLGKATVTVKAFNQALQLSLRVIEQDDVPLFGFNWCQRFGLPLPPGARVYNVESAPKKDTTQFAKRLDSLLNQHKALFDEQIGTIRGEKVVVHMDPNATPKVCKARPVPFALKGRVEEEIDSLLKRNIIECVDTMREPLEWASPIVVAVKPDGRLRLCADFKNTINPVISTEHHPLPRFDEIAVKLSGSSFFSVIDLKDAYLQMEVSECSRKYFVVATSKGYFRYRRLPFGIKFAPALFQKKMDEILSGLDHVGCMLDDIIIGGRTLEEHLTTLTLVLDRLTSYQVKVKREKCRWLQESVVYLGHRIDRVGIHPTEDHLDAIRNMPSPKNMSELKSFLGTINYYSKFIPNLQSRCTPLHELCCKGMKWKWTKKHEDAFQELRTTLSASDTLVHFRDDLPILVSADASEKGLGAVLLHKYPDGSERPVLYASRTLSNTESKYSSIDREALSLVFAVKKFEQYLYGKHFTLRTDHRPLLRILAEDKEIPKMAANRLARWAMTLSSFSYTIEHVPGIEHLPADTLSRLPLKSVEKQVEREDRLLQLRLDEIPVTKERLQKGTAQDEDLARVCYSVANGWPEKCKLPQVLHTYFEKREELSFEENILLWKGRIVVPKCLRQQFLKMMHEGHPGISAMRSLAQTYAWWPRIDSDINNYVKECTPCQTNRDKHPEVPIYSWNIPPDPWARVHVDFAGPFEGAHWMLITDAYTKWMEVIRMEKITSLKTILVLQEIFARYGLPKRIVTDNGPQFRSKEFKDFCKYNNIIHIRITPYHPRSNGLAERSVKTFKARMQASRNCGHWQKRLQEFLVCYRNSSQATTGRSPAELFLGRRIRTRLDLLKPDLFGTIDKNLLKQESHKILRSKLRQFEDGERVWVLRVPSGKGYEKGEITRKTGRYSYRVMINGIEHKRHADQMRKS